MNDSTGDRGPTGEAGVAGRQGEAGVSGPAGMPGETGLAGQTGREGEAGEVGRPGPTGRRGRSFSPTQILAVFAFVVIAFLVVSVRTEVQQRQISRNAERIEHVQLDNVRLQHQICVTRNAATNRQNALLDSAIEAEKRKPTPDAKRLKDLTAFKGATPNCGPEPR